MRSVIRNLATMLALVVAFAAPAVTSAQTNITATATVVVPVSVGGVVDMEFGDIVQNTAETVTVDDDATGQQAAEFTVTGSPASSATVEFTLPTDLTGPSASTLPLSAWQVKYGPNADASGGSTGALTSGQQIPITFDAGGVHYFRVGATATTAAGQTVGAYSGTITVTATFP